MFDLASAGTFLSGVGSLGGLFGGKSTSNAASKLSNFYKVDPYYYPVQSAKSNGLHPLFALGASGGVSPSFSVAGGGPSKEERAGDALGGLGHALEKMGNSAHRKVLEDLGVRQARADVKSSEYRAEMDALEYNRARQALLNNPTMATAAVDNPVPKGQTKTLPKEQISRSKKDSSSEAGSNPGFKKLEVAPGRFIEVPSEIEMDEIGSPGMVLTIMRSLGMLKGYDDPKTLTDQTHKQFRKWGMKPQQKRKRTGQMGRRRY